MDHREALHEARIYGTYLRYYVVDKALSAISNQDTALEALFEYYGTNLERCDLTAISEMLALLESLGVPMKMELTWPPACRDLEKLKVHSSIRYMSRIPIAPEVRRELALLSRSTGVFYLLKLAAEAKVSWVREEVIRELTQLVEDSSDWPWYTPPISP